MYAVNSKNVMIVTIKFLICSNLLICRQLNEDFENLVVPSGHRIHSLLEASFKVSYF